MIDGLIVLGSDNRVACFGKGAEVLLGLPAEAALGRAVEDMLRNRIPDIQLAQLLDCLAKVAGTVERTSESIEVELLQPHFRQLVATVSPLATMSGQCVIALLLEDVTEKRKIEQQKQRFIVELSHGLREPVTAIAGFASTLLAHSPFDPTQRQWVEYLYTSSERLKRISGELVQIVRIGSGNMTVKLERLRLEDALEAVLTLVIPATCIHQVTLEVEAGIPDVAADRIGFVRVMENLLNNAVKFSPRGGRVTISARYEAGKDRAVIGISDEGIGIAPEDRERIFAPFERVTRPETETIEGLGLGLYVARELVSLMHGEIWVEGELGKGSTFHVSLLTFQAGEAYAQRAI